MPEELDINAAVSDISADLGLGSNESEVEETETAETTETDSTERADATTEPETSTTAADAAQPVARAAPKSWAKEQHDRWGKLDKDTQDYIELREKQAEEGITRYSRDLRAFQEAVAPYQDVIRATGVEAPVAIKALMEAHKQMSVTDETARTAYFVRIAKHYGVDLGKLGAAQPASDEPQAVRELRERTERIERERAQERDAALSAGKERIATEVSTFADAKDDKGNAKHPYFDECATHIVALINAGHTLQEAYEQAVYANPVTRAKELARLQTESEASLRAKAKQEAEKARNASRANVNSRDTRRAPQAKKVGNWEEGMEETLQDIKSRTH